MAVRWRLIFRVTVKGSSMVPTLEAGERLLCVAIPRNFVLSEGAIVVVRDPRDTRNLLIKRITTIDEGGKITLIGDNEGVSIDSRHFGEVAVSAVEGRAIYIYSPTFFSLVKR